MESRKFKALIIVVTVISALGLFFASYDLRLLFKP